VADGGECGHVPVALRLGSDGVLHLVDRGVHVAAMPKERRLILTANPRSGG
jgi:hypothetical protein